MRLTLLPNFLSCIVTDSIPSSFQFYIFLVSMLKGCIITYIIIASEIPQLNSTVLITISKFYTMDCSLSSLSAIYALLYLFTILYTLSMLIFFVSLVFLVSKGKEGKTIRKLAKYLATVHVNQALTRCVNILTYTLIMSSENRFQMFGNDSVQTQTIFVGLSLFGIAINLLLGLVFSVFSFNYSFGDKTARMPSFIEVFQLVSKFGIFLNHFLKSNMSEKLSDDCLIMIASAEVAIVLILILNSPDFDIQMTIARTRFNSIKLSLVLTYFLRNALTNAGMTLSLFWAISFVMIAYVLQCCVDVKMAEVLDLNSKNSSITKAIKKLTYLSEIISIDPTKEAMNASISKKFLIFSGILRTHRLDCKDSNCICWFFESQGSNKMDALMVSHSYQEFYENSLLDICNRLIASVKENTWLKIAFSKVVLKTQPSHYPKAINSIYTIKDHEHNLFSRLACYQIYVQVRDHIALYSINSKHEVDIKKYLSYKTASDKFKNKLKSSVESTIKFWVGYMEDTPALRTLFYLGRDANYSDDKVTLSWKKLNFKYGMFLIDEYLIYAAYKILVRNSRLEGNKLVKSYNNKLRDFLCLNDNLLVSNQTLIDVHNIFVSIHMDKEKLGTISEVKGNIYDTLGYSHLEVKGYNISLLVPRYARDKHDFYLHQHLDKANTTMIYKNRQLFASHKEGYIVPVYAYICPLPFIENGLKYIGILRPIRKFGDCVIFSMQGDILSWTRSLESEFDLSQQEKKNIRDLCPLFEHLILIINTYEWIQNNLTDQEKVTFKVLKKKMEGKLIDDPYSKRLLIPENVDDYNGICVIYSHLYNHGIPLDFIGPMKDFKYNCKLISDQLNVDSCRFMIMDKISTQYKRGKHHTSTAAKAILGLHYLQTLVDKPDSKRNTIYQKEWKRGKMNPKFESTFVNQKENGESMIYDEIEVNPNHNDDNLILKSAPTTFIIDLQTKVLNEIEKEEQMSIASHPESSAHQFGHDYLVMNLINRRGDGESMTSMKIRKDVKNAEILVHETKQDTSFRVFGFSITSFFIVILIAWFYFYFYAQNKLSIIQSTINGLTGADERYQSLLKFMKAVRKIEIFEHDILDTKYVGPLPEFKEKVFETIRESIDDMGKHTAAIVDAYSYLSDSEFVKITDGLILYPPEDKSQSIDTTLEEAFSLIESLGLQIYNHELNKTKRQVKQVLKYGNDEILVRSGKLMVTFLKNMEVQLDAMQMYLKTIVIFKCIISAVLFGMFIKFNFKIVHFQNDLIESILTIQESKYIPFIQKIEEYYAVLSDKNFEKSLFKKTPKIMNSKDSKKVKSQIKRHVRRTNLLKASFRKIIAKLFLFLVLISGSVAFMVIILYTTEKIRNFSESLVSNSQLNCDYIQMVTSLDNYFFNPQDTLKGNPISEEIWTSLDSLKKSRRFYLDLIPDDETGSSILEIVKSNLCFRYRSKIPSLEDCMVLADGALSYGLAATLNVMIEYGNSLLLRYEANKNIQGVRVIFSMKKYYELSELGRYYVELPFDEIRNILNDRIQYYNEYNTNFIISMNFGYLALTLLIGVCSRLIYKSLKFEKINTRRILSLVPTELIIEKSFVSRYL